MYRALSKCIAHDLGQVPDYYKVRKDEILVGPKGSSKLVVMKRKMNDHTYPPKMTSVAKTKLL